MDQSTMGTHVLHQADLIDIVKRHFYRFGQGFKFIQVIVDQSKVNEPTIGLELKLESLNKKLPNNRIEQLYYLLLDTCKEVTNVEDEILKKMYNMVIKKEITQDEFSILIKKLKGH